MSFAIGAAVAEPDPPWSIITEIAYWGSIVGPYPTNKE